MVGSFEFEAELRSRSGKGDARRARRQGKVPAIIYGGDSSPVQINLDHNNVVKALENEATYSHILSLKFDGKEEKVILKALQRHPARPTIMHMDFQRVNEKDKLRAHVPLHFVNQDTSIGVKKGGVVTHAVVEVEVQCLPQHLPEFIEVDLANLDIGDSVHLADLSLPVGVEIPALAQGPEQNIVVAAIRATRSADVAE